MDFDAQVAEARSALKAASFAGISRRSASATFEIRANAAGGYTLVGHAAVFGKLSENLGGFREIIEVGAFRRVLSGRPDTRALFNHDPNLVLARTTNNSLRMTEDEVGLHYEADVADTSYGRDLKVLLERGDVSQSSFAFRLASGGDSWEEDPDTGGLIRRINEFSDLFDVSPVTYPAYVDTDASARSAAPETSHPEAERSAQAEAPEQGDKAAFGSGPVEDPNAWRASARDRDLRIRERAIRI